MNGRGRLALGDMHDRGLVVPELETRGYELEEFGQALLSAAVRRSLRQRTSLVRWLPDHAVKVPGAEKRLALIDSKTCTGRNRASANHAVEFRSILGAMITRIPTFYVCCDLKVLPAQTLYTVLRAGRQAWPCCVACMETFRTGLNELQIADQLPEYCPAHTGNGSGTPYVRFPKTWCDPMDSVFPSLMAAGVR